MGALMAAPARQVSDWFDAKRRILFSGNFHLMNPKELLEANLSLVERVIARVCLKAHLTGADAEDFASTARLHLIENDYHVLRQHDPSSSLAAYLAVVLQRLLCDERNRTRGRWRPSAEAKRMGASGVLLETLLLRDRRPLQEVVPIVTSTARHLTARDIEAMAARLPERAPRVHSIELDETTADTTPAAERADARVMEEEHRKLARRTQEVLRDAMAAMPLEDRMIVKLRFGSAMNVADVARILRLEQRPLYRRIELLLDRMRQLLAQAGIDSSIATELIGSATADLDLGLADSGGQP